MVGYAILGAGCAVLIVAALWVGNERPLWFLGAAVVVMMGLIFWHSSRFGYRCPNCGTEFSVPPLQDFVALHAAGTKFLTCPQCKRKDWARMIAKGAR
jgi:predicted RNA-binding Zn-ribbon protein involved in translation (DUF1610 family)